MSPKPKKSGGLDLKDLVGTSTAEVVVSSERYGNVLWELPEPVIRAIEELPEAEQKEALKDAEALLRGWLHIMHESIGVRNGKTLLANALKKTHEEIQAHKPKS